MKRVKKAVAGAVVKTREDLEKCVGEIAALSIQRDALLVEMDAKLQSIRQEYEGKLGDLVADIDAELGLAEAWCDAHKAEFTERKSIEMVHGTIGYRTGNPTLFTVRGVTWKTALERVLRLGMRRFIRRKLELNRELILMERTALGAEKLTAMGLFVDQPETFFVEPKRETAPDAAQAGGQ